MVHVTVVKTVSKHMLQKLAWQASCDAGALLRHGDTYNTEKKECSRFTYQGVILVAYIPVPAYPGLA